MPADSSVSDHRHGKLMCLWTLELVLAGGAAIAEHLEIARLWHLLRKAAPGPAAAALPALPGCVRTQSPGAGWPALRALALALT